MSASFVASMPYVGVVLIHSGILFGMGSKLVSIVLKLASFLQKPSGLVTIDDMRLKGSGHIESSLKVYGSICGAICANFLLGNVPACVVACHMCGLKRTKQ